MLSCFQVRSDVRDVSIPRRTKAVRIPETRPFAAQCRRRGSRMESTSGLATRHHVVGPI